MSTHLPQQQHLVKNPRRRRWIAAAVVVGLFLFFTVVKFTKRPLEPQLVTVSKGTIVEESEAIGYIKPWHSITIKSQVDGIVDEIYHYEGEFVTKDTPLLKVKPAPAPSVYADAHQQVIDAKAKEAAAMRDLTRYQHALKVGLIGNNYTDYIRAQQNHDTTKAQLILAEQKLALLEQGNTMVAGKPIANIVTSPTDGYILNRIVNVGDPIISLSSAQSATPIFTIADMKDLMFQGVVDEMDAARIKPGMAAKITVGSLPDEQVIGTLTRIAMQSESENANTSKGATSNAAAAILTNSPFNVGFKVEITKLQLANKNMVLRSGYSATAKIKIKTAENVLVLPARVIQFKDDKPYVLLPVAAVIAGAPSSSPLPAASGENKNNQGKGDGSVSGSSGGSGGSGGSNRAAAIKQRIEIGATDGVNVEIKSGLKLGDKVLDRLERAKDNE
jgi:HlyD family secretion protein